MSEYASLVMQWTWNIVFICGCFVAYFPQYLQIVREKNIEGFSINVSLLLVGASVLKVFFWFLKKFEIILLYQAFAMILTHLMLLSAITSVKSTLVQSNKKSSHFRDFILYNFWKWDNLIDYIECIGAICILMTILCLLFSSSELFTEVLGWVSLMFEGCFAVPQAMRNYQNKSVAGLSIPLVISWIIGDVPKLIFFIIGEAPIQFTSCAIFQILVDLFIIWQIYHYKGGHRTIVKSDRSQTIEEVELPIKVKSPSSTV